MSLGIAAIPLFRSKGAARRFSVSPTTRTSEESVVSRGLQRVGRQPALVTLARALSNQVRQFKGPYD